MVQALIKGMKKIIEGNRIGGEGCFSGDSMVNKPPTNAGDMGLIPDPGRSPEEGNSYPLQYSCLGNAMDSRAWWAIGHGLQNHGYDLVTKHQPHNNRMGKSFR